MYTFIKCTVNNLPQNILTMKGVDFKIIHAFTKK